MAYEIRPMQGQEVHLLRDFLYEAIFQRDESNLLPPSVIDDEPALGVYIDDFGGPDDLCLVAVAGDKIVGAVWTRILAGKVRGFGNIDCRTPEFAISLYRQYRGLGLGTKLMEEMLLLLREKGYQKTSLAVQKDNYAVKMYQKVGFSTVSENEQEYIMVADLRGQNCAE